MSTPNPNLIEDTTVARMMGFSIHQVGHARRKLEDEGIKVWPGKGGRWFITLQQLNAARGITDGAANDAGELL